MTLLAHADHPIAPHELWGAWTLDPWVLVPLAVVVLLYGRTVRRRWRDGAPATGLSPRRVLLFALGVLVLLVALVSPLDALSEALFAAHMVQHLLLALVAPPLLLLGRVHLGLQPSLPLRLRREGGRRLGRALRGAPVAVVVAAVALHLGTMAVWHVPLFYDAAVSRPLLHTVEHVTLLVTAVPFWAVLGAARARPVAAAGLAAFVASFVSVLMSAAMTVATGPWYDSHSTSTRAWGLSPLEDQHMAAAVMWVPGGLVYLSAAAVAVFQWIRADERRLALQRSREQPTAAPDGSEAIVPGRDARARRPGAAGR